MEVDLRSGFIMAEVMAYSDLKELGSEAAVKAPWADGRWVRGDQAKQSPL